MERSGRHEASAGRWGLTNGRARCDNNSRASAPLSGQVPTVAISQRLLIAADMLMTALDKRPGTRCPQTRVAEMFNENGDTFHGLKQGQ